MKKIRILSPKHTRYNWNGIKKNLKSAELSIIQTGIKGEKKIFLCIDGNPYTISKINLFRIKLRYWLVGWKVYFKFWGDYERDENGNLRAECLEIKLRCR